MAGVPIHEVVNRHDAPHAVRCNERQVAVAAPEDVYSALAQQCRQARAEPQRSLAQRREDVLEALAECAHLVAHAAVREQKQGRVRSRAPITHEQIEDVVADARAILLEHRRIDSNVRHRRTIVPS
jgi:hypothetical protein